MKKIFIVAAVVLVAFNLYFLITHNGDRRTPYSEFKTRIDMAQMREYHAPDSYKPAGDIKHCINFLLQYSRLPFLVLDALLYLAPLLAAVDAPRHAQLHQVAHRPVAVSHLLPHQGVDYLRPLRLMVHEGILHIEIQVEIAQPTAHGTLDAGCLMAYVLALHEVPAIVGFATFPFTCTNP